MNTYSLFASICKKPEDIPATQRAAHALNLVFFSEMHSFPADSLDDATSQFHQSSQFESFAELHTGRSVYTYLIQEDGSVILV